MDPSSFERLLYEDESTTLDFKEEQYPFAKATEEAKSELLKDIVGFANAWRRSEAYILIGVKEVRGGRSVVVGVSEHLNDHSLQQFVNNLTNRPVLFQYEAFGFEGKQVGIIRIDEQPRPIYLKRDYGKLRKEAVYVRRGSSIDPNKPASLDEVARMGQSSLPDQAELSIGLAEAGRDIALGTDISLDAEFCSMRTGEKVPRYGHPNSSPFGISLSSIQSNEGYWRELVDYEFVRRLFRPLRLLVVNTGKVAAGSVQVELRADFDPSYSLCHPSEMPDPPRKEGDLFSGRMPDIAPALGRRPGDLAIEHDEERFLVRVDCGDLQPGRKVWSEPFVVGSAASRSIVLVGHIYAENLARPKEVSLSVTLNVSRREMSFEEIRSLSPPEEVDDGWSG